jgi:predicted dehydrogenase
MAAPPIPPIRLGLIGTGLAVEKLHWPALRGLADRYEVTAFTDSSAEQSRRFADYSGVGPARVAADRAAAFLALAAGHPDRTFVVGENFFYRDDLRYARALLDGGVHLDVGVHHIAQIRLLCGDIARVHGAVQAANSTIDAPSDLALNLVFTGGAIGNYTASYPEIPVPPEPNDMRLYGTEGVLAGSSSERRVTHSGSDATTHKTVFRGIDNGYRAERGQGDGRPAGSRLRGTGGRTGARPRARRGPGTAVAAPWLDRAVRRAARTTHQQFGVFRRMNDPQRGARLAVPAVATSLRR